MRYLFTISTWLLVIAAAVEAQAACLPPVTEQARQASASWQVVDGDTLHLGGANKLRLAMINTPELGRDGRPDQPYARAAKLAAVDFLQGGDWYWQVGHTSKDHYGRWLGSVVNQQQQWLAAHLVGLGLAYVISVGDNAAPLCLWQLEAKARAQGLGLWSAALGQARPSRQLVPSDAGFMLLAGKVEKVATGGDHWYVDLQGPVTLQVNRQQWRHLGGDDPRQWLGKAVTVRGWLSWRKLSKKQRQRGFKPAKLALSHPHMLTLVETD